MLSVPRSQIEALLQLTASGLDKGEDEEFISYHLGCVINSFLASTSSGKHRNSEMAELSLKCLINLTPSSERVVCMRNILTKDNHLTAFAHRLSELMLSRDCPFGDLIAGLASNLTRDDVLWLDALVSEVDVGKLVMAICEMDKFNPNWKTDQLPQVLLNFSRKDSVRRQLCAKPDNLIGRLISFTKLKYSLVRRAAVAGLIKNCCFEDAVHMHLLGPEVDLLSAILLPLCGPDDVIDDEDMMALPDDVIMVPGNSDTVREPDVGVRICLCQALLQLCSTQEGRQYLKTKSVYPILRELHKWEQDPEAVLSIEHVVDILIGDDPPEGMTHLRKVEVPGEVAERVEQSNKVFLEPGSETKDTIVTETCD